MARCRLDVRATTMVLVGSSINVPPCLAAAAHLRSPLRRSPRWLAAASRAAVRVACLYTSTPSIRDTSTYATISLAWPDSRLTMLPSAAFAPLALFAAEAAPS
ncbi:hypothetical protein Syun_006622 [Stephania yunnanensis]|uniref:Uncharacterized protein n=1 Tax=Stephania yunnanensis TaxID=152371 RepID=A0AAP0KX34_9MAGN